MDNRLLTVAEVSNVLRINKNAVYKLIKAGYIKALKLGSIKVTTRELDRFINEAEGKDYTDLDNVIELECG